jgi:L-malate glycosyltransferase
MRVLYLLDHLNRGGAETLALDICRNAHRHGIELTCVATGGGSMEGEFQRSGVEFIRLRRRLKFDPGVAYALRRIVRERKIRIVHANQAVEALHALVACAGLDVKFILSLHCLTYDAKNVWTLKFLLPRMNAVVSVSEAAAELQRALLRPPARVRFHAVHNAVDPQRLIASGAGLRAELGVSQNQRLLGMIGNFTHVKDQKTVCQALPSVFARFPDAWFVFVGEPMTPRFYDECVDLCRKTGVLEKVRFLGGRTDTAEILRDLDVFVLSSHEDTFGIALAEAMLAGAPAIASDIPALAEVSGGGEYATLFRAGNPESLTEKLVEALGDDERRAALSEKAKRWACERYSISVYLTRLRGLYERTLAGQNKERSS